jgi:glutamate synthase domain-containing protein 2
MTIFLIIISLFVVWFCFDRFIVKNHTLRTNFPIIGLGRYLIEKWGPPLRQYIVAGNREEAPYNRIRRNYVYATSKGQNRYKGFGSDDNQTNQGHIVIPHSAFPTTKPKGFNPYFLPCLKVMGKNRKNPFFVENVFNISAMSYGSLSDRATMANNIGASLAGSYHNTGEGGVAPYHDLGARLVYQIGTGYFGCRDSKGNFSMEELLKTVEKHPNIKAIEIKLSQGAKAGKGGVLLASKITKEIAEVRGIPEGKDCMSPAYHQAFSDIPSLLDFIEEVAEATGIPVGIKFCVGDKGFPMNLAGEISKNGGTKKPDFITVDGGEGGTGAAPTSFSDHVGLTFDQGFPIVYKAFTHFGLDKDIVFIGSAKLGYPAMAIKAFAMGCDVINIAREALFAIGCLQTQDCHKGNCPVGIATQKKWLVNGFNIEDKSLRLGLYLDTLKKDVWEITHAAGLDHPAQFDPYNVYVVDKDKNVVSLNDSRGMVKRAVIVPTTEELQKLNKTHNSDLTSTKKIEKQITFDYAKKIQ